jgi:phosphate transport system permease protein
MQKWRKIYFLRDAKNVLAKIFALGATLIALFFLAWIIGSILYRGLPHLNLSIFTQITPPPGGQGGLLNAIVGSLMMVLSAIIIGSPIAVIVAVYLSEFGYDKFFAVLTRYIIDILLSAPSVILGLYVYQVYVLSTGGFSGWAGVIVLVLIVIPIVVKATENVLGLVPANLKEAAAALGAPRWKILFSIIFPIAKVGIITGTALAIARISGETAPLLFTALNNQFMSLDMNKPMANLPSVIFQFALSPYKDWHDLAWTGALLLTFMVVLLNISVRIIFRQKIITH